MVEYANGMKCAEILGWGSRVAAGSRKNGCFGSVFAFLEPGKNLGKEICGECPGVWGRARPRDEGRDAES